MDRTMRQARSAKNGALVLASVLCLFAASACGTRLSDSQIVAGQRVTVSGVNYPGGFASGGQGNAVTGNGASGDGGGALLGGSGAGSGALPGGGSGSNGGRGSGGAATGSGSGGSNGSGGSGGAATGGVSRGGSGSGGSNGSGGSGSTGGGGSSGGGGAVAPAGAPCTQQLAPIVIGQDGVFSGLVGQSTGDQRLGLSVWSNWVNDNGGIQCHPVKLYQEDDGSDPSKTAANINDLVKNKHAIALVGLNVPITMASARSAASQLGVPIVGGDGGDDVWNRDPNLFLSGGSSMPVWGGGIVEAVHETGFKKLGLVYCIEATPCQQMHDNFSKDVAAAGGQAVFQQSVSLTQSDYTAECQNAKNAGAQIIGVYVDAASTQRFARSCRSIGYNPVLETGGLAISSTVMNDPNLQAMTLYVGSTDAPYTATGTPGLSILHAAFKKYTGSDVPDEPAVMGWSAGMLFKAAIDALGTAARKGPITTAMVYQGLYSLKNETLGGLAPSLNFAQGKPSGVIPCYTIFKVTTKGIQTPGPNFKCVPWSG